MFDEGKVSDNIAKIGIQMGIGDKIIIKPCKHPLESNNTNIGKFLGEDDMAHAAGDQQGFDILFICIHLLDIQINECFFNIRKPGSAQVPVKEGIFPIGKSKVADLKVADASFDIG